MKSETKGFVVVGVALAAVVGLAAFMAIPSAPKTNAPIRVQQWAHAMNVVLYTCVCDGHEKQMVCDVRTINNRYIKLRCDEQRCMMIDASRSE